MFLHKCEKSGNTYYRIASSPHPSKQVTLNSKEWGEGISTSNADVVNALKRINQAFTEEPKIEVEEGEAPKKEKKEKKALSTIASHIKDLSLGMEILAEDTSVKEEQLVSKLKARGLKDEAVAFVVKVLNSLSNKAQAFTEALEEAKKPYTRSEA